VVNWLKWLFHETLFCQLFQGFVLYLDTGFLSLPSEIIVALNLPWTGIDRGTLGDGSEVTFEVYAAMIIWDGQYRNIPVNEAETDPLVGMSLLYGYDLQIRAVEGGNVTIKAIE
jgi:predicted aspartyl protease